MLKSADISADSLAYITYWADNVAAGADRREADDSSNGTIYDKYVPLKSVFNILNGNKENMAYPLKMVLDSGEINYPVSDEIKYSEHEYSKIVDNIKSGLLQTELTEGFLNSMLSVMEANLSFIPSSTDTRQLIDISLYDHLKMTAAIGSCIYEYLCDAGISDYRTALVESASDYYQRDIFLMYSMDISGVQDFIYNVDSSEALKSLRSKSFYLEIMLEHIIDELLTEINLSRANLIYSGGGHAYILLPNTDEVKNKINEFDRKTRKWFIKNFGIDLYIAMGYVECSANNLMNKPEGSYSEIFRGVSRRLSQKKVCRYSTEEISELNKFDSKMHERECKICGRTDMLTEENICEFCASFKNISRGILDDSFVAITDTPNESNSCIRMPFDRYMTLVNERQLKNIIESDSDYIRSYSKNKMYTGINVSTKLWVGDYSSSSSFEELASASTGIKRLGVLRADVDNLGQAFVAGFPQNFSSLSRAATFSRKLSMLFKLNINSILTNPEYSIGTKKEMRNVSIVYSGGDDIFLVGAWDDVLEAGIDIHEAVEKYTQGTLTISAGIGIFPGKYPVKSLARETGVLESASKDVPGKNSVTLFDAKDGSHTYKWDILKAKVIGEKYRVIDDYFSVVPEKGMAAIYKLMDYIRNTEDVINIARLAYLLGRMEPEKNASDKVRDKYNRFSKKLYEWVSGLNMKSDRQQLITAMYLYIYIHRERKEADNG